MCKSPSKSVNFGFFLVNCNKVFVFLGVYISSIFHFILKLFSFLYLQRIEALWRLVKWNGILHYITKFKVHTGCPPKKVYSSKFSCIQKMVKINDMNFQTLFMKCLCIHGIGLCKTLNLYMMFYLSYQCQKMSVSSMALHSFNLII